MNTMQQQTRTTDTSTSQSEVYQNNSQSHSEPEITNQPVEYTPFRLIGQKNKGYFITIADQRLSEYFETEAEALQSINDKNWNLIANLIISIITIVDKNKIKQ